MPITFGVIFVRLKVAEKGPTPTDIACLKNRWRTFQICENNETVKGHEKHVFSDQFSHELRLYVAAAGLTVRNGESVHSMSF